MLAWGIDLRLDMKGEDMKRIIESVKTGMKIVFIVIVWIVFVGLSILLYGIFGLLDFFVMDRESDSASSYYKDFMK